jgi:hypothetical protein
MNNQFINPQEVLDTVSANVTLRAQISDAFGTLMLSFSKRLSLQLYRSVKIGSPAEKRYKASFDASEATHHLMLFLTAANAAAIRDDARTLLEIIEEWKLKMSEVIDVQP